MPFCNGFVPWSQSVQGHILRSIAEKRICPRDLQLGTVVATYAEPVKCEPPMRVDVSLLLGEDALSQIESPAFLDRWAELAQLDPKFTLLQEPPFVLAWYRAHLPIYEPLLCLGNDPEGNLVGLMPLARSRTSGEITHAGERHAEYYGWIALPEVDEPFFHECLFALNARFRLKRWEWKWLPPGTPVHYLTSPRLAEREIFVSFQIEQSPVWNLNDSDRLNEMLRHKAAKNKLNYYKRRGGFGLERVRDPQRTSELMQTVRAQSDFRHEAIHGNCPFADNSFKEPFFLQRQAFPDANHFSVLWSEGRPLSFHFSACDRRTLLLGLTAFDPSESRNSPGKFHFLELAKMLVEEGVERIDLTPGGDPYKEYFANEHQEVILPTFYFSSAARRRAQFTETCRSSAKRALGAVRVTPDRVREITRRARELPSRLRRATPGKLAAKVQHALAEDVVYLQYQLDLREVRDLPPRDPEIHRQQYQDLMLYRGGDPWTDRQELLSRAIKRFTAGSQVYTVVRDERLVHYGWTIPGGRTHQLSTVDVSFDSPADSAILYDFFTHPDYRGQGLYSRALRQALRDLADSGVKTALVGVLEGNEASRRGIEGAGFTFLRSFRKTRVLWRTSKERRERE